MSIKHPFSYIVPDKDEVIADILRRMANSQTIQEHELRMVREHVRETNKPMLGTKETI